MAQKKYWESIEVNFEKVDRALANLSQNSLQYKLLFSLRTLYCVNDEVKRHKGELTLICKIKETAKLFLWIILYPFVCYKTENKSEVVILGGWRFDDSLSQHISVDILKIERKYRLARWSDFAKGFKLFGHLISLLFNCNIKFFKMLRCLSEGVKFYRLYNDINLDGVKIIITEDDIMPLNVAILMRAMEIGVKRVKIEYVQIDSIVHNNVFCDYYFYPTTYHQRIRENSAWNKNLIYIEGGYLNTDYLKYKLLSKPHILPGYVTFYTSHSDIFEYDDTFYIEQIIALLPDHFTLCIKVHPYDKQNKYDCFEGKQNVEIFKFGSIDNAELIAQTSICLSQFSVMSLEAKQNCDQSYFLNYAWKYSQFATDYSYLNEFFDTIDSPETLEMVLKGQYKPVSIEKFRKNVNMTFPNTFEIFNKFIKSINN